MKITKTSEKRITCRIPNSNPGQRIQNATRIDINAILLQSLAIVSTLLRAAGNATNATTTQMNGTANGHSRSDGPAVPIVAILIPLTAAVIIAVVIILLCVGRKRKLQRKREKRWKRNLESSISWLDAFELPQTLRVFNDFSEHTDFVIPMGPLHRNNFAFENFDPSAQENITEQFSKKRRTSGSYSYKSKKRSDIYPIDNEVLTNRNDSEHIGKLTTT